MVIIFPHNVPGSGIVNRNLCKSALAVKNSTKGLDKVPSTASKKKFAAKLRKVRWRIYRDIDLRRENIIKSLKYYKRQVRLFLKCFSKNLKPEEPSIFNKKFPKHLMMFMLSKEIKRRRLRLVAAASVDMRVILTQLCSCFQLRTTLWELTQLIWAR